MDIIINEHGLGFLARGDRYWVFLDSIVQIERFRDDTWTILCYHGQVINIPVSLISQETIGHMQAKSEYGRTPDGIRAAINRGYRMLDLLVTEGEDKRSSSPDGKGKPND